jgi:hypothetical protein
LSNRSNQILLLAFLILGFILLYSSNQEVETGPPVWKSDVYYDNLFYRDEIPEEYRIYIQFSARVINRSFPYIEETGTSGDTTWVAIGLKEVLGLITSEILDDGVSRFILYSESFGLFDIPAKMNNSVDGRPVSKLIDADYVEVSGYRFDVSSGRTRYSIFCIKNVIELVYSIETSRGNVDVVIDEADYPVSGRDAIDLVLDMMDSRKIFKIETFSKSSGRLLNGTKISKKVWWVHVYVTPPERLSGSFFEAFVDVNTGEVYELHMISWATDT